MLTPVALPSFLDADPVPADTTAKLATMRSRIEAFEDCWHQHHAAQFVAADYELVHHALRWLGQNQPAIGRKFLEWGCGFAVVSALAADLGWNAHAVEAHPDLLVQARRTLDHWETPVTLAAGNFLPPGAEQLADDPTLPSLGHGGPCIYDCWNLDLDDFALVYSYPWPGEDTFHEDVFDAYAAVGAMLLMFIGPNEMRLIRKTG